MRVLMFPRLPDWHGHHKVAPCARSRRCCGINLELDSPPIPRLEPATIILVLTPPRRKRRGAFKILGDFSSGLGRLTSRLQVLIAFSAKFVSALAHIDQSHPLNAAIPLSIFATRVN